MDMFTKLIDEGWAWLIAPGLILWLLSKPALEWMKLKFEKRKTLVETLHQLYTEQGEEVKEICQMCDRCHEEVTEVKGVMVLVSGFMIRTADNHSETERQELNVLVEKMESLM